MSETTKHLESWKTFELSDADKVLAAPKSELIKFCRTLVGGSWASLRRKSKEALATEIVCWAKNERSGNQQPWSVTK